MGDFERVSSPTSSGKRIYRAVAIVAVVVMIWPGPVIIGKFEATKFKRNCEGIWQGNVSSFQNMEVTKNETDFVGSGLNFTQPWTTESTLGHSSCFHNLYPAHLLAIQHFEGALLEYSRQSNLDNFGMAPPVFDYPRYSQVQFICHAPGLLRLRWKTSCDTFLNVP